MESSVAPGCGITDGASLSYDTHDTILKRRKLTMDGDMTESSEIKNDFNCLVVIIHSSYLREPGFRINFWMGKKCRSYEYNVRPTGTASSTPKSQVTVSMA